CALLSPGPGLAAATPASAPPARATVPASTRLAAMAPAGVRNLRRMGAPLFVTQRHPPLRRRPPRDPRPADPYPRILPSLGRPRLLTGKERDGASSGC